MKPTYKSLNTVLVNIRLGEKLDFMATNVPLSNAIMILRKSQGLTASQLGKKAGVSRNYIGLIESGQGNPTLTVLLKILAALNWQAEINLGQEPTHE